MLHVLSSFCYENLVSCALLVLSLLFAAISVVSPTMVLNQQMHIIQSALWAVIFATSKNGQWMS